MAAAAELLDGSHLSRCSSAAAAAAAGITVIHRQAVDMPHNGIRPASVNITRGRR